MRTVRTLIVHLDRHAGDMPETVVSKLAGGTRPLVQRSSRTARRSVAEATPPLDALLVCGDDGPALLDCCRTLVAAKQAPPIIVLSACTSTEIAAGLIKAGASDFIARDPEQGWVDKLVARLAQTDAAGTRPETLPQVGSPIAHDGQRLARIIDGSSVPMFVIDSEHRVTQWNRACEALTGIAAREVIGTRDQWRAFYAEERPCLADLVVDGALDMKLTRYYGSKRIHRSAIIEGGFEAEDFFAAFGNSGRWLYFTAAPLHDDAGKVVGAIETLQDITEQKRAEDQLRQSEERYRVLSITDGMTGLYNARHFAQRLREEMDRCERYRHSLSLMVLDVDNFKQFNDTWGHVQGDQVLIQLAECITACLRRTDQAFRYGGEEFVALLPETNLDEAVAAAERIRALFERCDVGPTSGQRIECTTSIGVTAYVPGETPRDFVARADSGTYEAKRQGKNRVIRILPPERPA